MIYIKNIKNKPGKPQVEGETLGYDVNHARKNKKTSKPGYQTCIKSRFIQKLAQGYNPVAH
jgi:hypothetical protein